MPRPVIACANTVSENMGIRTTGELVEKCREGVMEFLLINHPLDCPICDQAGECRLQEHSVEHGRGVSRFVDMKVKKPKNVDIGPRIRLDDERCIMCSRCIRFMDEVAGDPVLGFTQRGTHTTLTVHPGRLLDSNYSLNTVDICPVGALTSNDFRFQMRVWFLKETPTHRRQLRHRLQHHRLDPRQQDLPHHPAPERRGQLLPGCRIPTASISTTSTARRASPSRSSRTARQHEPVRLDRRARQAAAAKLKAFAARSKSPSSPPAA